MRGNQAQKKLAFDVQLNNIVDYYKKTETHNFVVDVMAVQYIICYLAEKYVICLMLI